MHDNVSLKCAANVGHKGASLEDGSSFSCPYSPAGNQKFKRQHEGGQHVVPLERTVPVTRDGLKLIRRHWWNGVWALIKSVPVAMLWGDKKEEYFFIFLFLKSNSQKSQFAI